MTPRQISPTRRQFLAGASALPLAGCYKEVAGPAPAPFASSGPRGLNSIAETRGRRFGTAISWNKDNRESGSIHNPDYTGITNFECGVVVPENEMKWQTVRPGPDSYDFTRMDDIVRWAKTNGQAVRGHTLLWHRPKWFPEWLNTYDFGANPRATAERMLTEHIRTVTNRYDGVISSYDVVNEAIDHDTNAPMETSLSRAMGSAEAVLDLSFHIAREQLPKGELVYNDYMSWEPGHANHRADVLRLLAGFRKRGTPVDALGIQSHIEMYELDPTTGVGPYQEREWRGFLDEVTGMGYRLLITEFDVKDKALPSDIATRDARVADFTRRYFDVMLDYPQLVDILAWGMVDKFSWLQSFAPRDDGLEVRACPYDSNYSAKPMRTVLAELLGST